MSRSRILFLLIVAAGAAMAAWLVWHGAPPRDVEFNFLGYTNHERGRAVMFEVKNNSSRKISWNLHTRVIRENGVEREVQIQPEWPEGFLHSPVHMPPGSTFTFLVSHPLPSHAGSVWLYGYTTPNRMDLRRMKVADFLRQHGWGRAEKWIRPRVANLRVNGPELVPPKK